MSVYTQGSDEKIGTVSDALIDEQGNFRYLIVDLGLDFLQESIATSWS